MSEHTEQAALFSWAELASGRYPELGLMFAIPNGAKLPYKKDKRGRRYSPEAMKLKKEGLRSGVPDVCLPVARQGFHGLFVEMKIKGNRPSDAQKEYIAQLNMQGYAVVVAYGWDAAREAIEDYLGIA